MPVKAFTDRWLKSAGPFDTTMEFVDEACPNLWVRIGKRRKSFSVLIGPASRRRRLPIGPYPTVSIAEARTKATELLADPRAAGGGRPSRGGDETPMTQPAFM
ncbi:MAG: Arm DNA-binding domain-containing protein [Pseudomonadota bacterium]